MDFRQSVQPHADPVAAALHFWSNWPTANNRMWIGVIIRLAYCLRLHKQNPVCDCENLRYICAKLVNCTRICSPTDIETECNSNEIFRDRISSNVDENAQVWWREGAPEAHCTASAH